MNDTTIRPAGDGRALKLKAATTTTHDRLDRQIMAGRPFESLARYGLFLQRHQKPAGALGLPDSGTCLSGVAG